LRTITGDPEPSGSAGNVGDCVSVTLALSVTGLTTRAAVIAALAITALLLTGWRKPARAEPRSHRAGLVPVGAPRRDTGRSGIVVDHLDTPGERRPGPIRRVVALAASGGIGLLTGVLAAIVIAYAAAFAVIWLTNLLER
jgi:hypothetical protein